MKIHCLQVNSDLAESPENRLGRILGKLELVDSDTDLLVLPEHWISGAFNDFSELGQCIKLYQDFISNAIEISKRKNMHIISGSGLVIDLKGVVRNTLHLLSPTNESILSYSKIHPFTQELGNVSGGEEILTCEVSEMRVSTAICYDLRFPEIFRQPANIGSELFVVVAAWPVSRIETWKHLLRARAIENQAFVVGINGTGVQDSATLGGYSMVVGPSGEVLALSEELEGEIRFNLDPKMVISHRKDFHYLDDVKLLAGINSKSDKKLI
ncbi:nitrilase-related carbon-nitrogen hydrolase [Candidatus Planktophila dulcis]|jgi:predicted amidohydrolase|uniref:nitrilase-related carbon-nitrogen hydrolase n=1 Tax=Candidatus Planktophila dulcis TaxID=1884914 RepID=UPI003CF57CE0